MSCQSLTHYTAGCFTCGASVAARNATAWAHNHVRKNPGHRVELSLGWIVTEEPAGSVLHQARKGDDGPS